MSHSLPFRINESLEQLKKLHKGSKSKLQPRLQMLIILKKEGKSLFKNILSERLGVNHNGIQQWKTNYRKGGLNCLLSDKRGGNPNS